MTHNIDGYNFVLTKVLSINIIGNIILKIKEIGLSEKKEWSKDQKALTRDILERVDVVAFSFDISGINKGCTLNHLNGDYGYIKLKDALSNNWSIYNYETDELIITFDSVEDIINGGWKVST